MTNKKEQEDFSCSIDLTLPEVSNINSEVDSKNDLQDKSMNSQTKNLPETKRVLIMKTLKVFRVLVLVMPCSKL